MDGYPPTLCAPVAHPLMVPPPPLSRPAEMWLTPITLLTCGYGFLSKGATGDERSPPIYQPAKKRKSGSGRARIPPPRFSPPVPRKCLLYNRIGGGIRELRCGPIKFSCKLRRITPELGAAFRAREGGPSPNGVACWCRHMWHRTWPIDVTDSGASLAGRAPYFVAVATLPALVHSLRLGHGGSFAPASPPGRNPSRSSN